MACFKILKHIYDTINKLQWNFLWGQVNQEGQIHWIKWKILKKSKSNEGMGFNDLHLVNCALLVKQC